MKNEKSDAQALKEIALGLTIGPIVQLAIGLLGFGVLYVLWLIVKPLLVALGNADQGW